MTKSVISSAVNCQFPRGFAKGSVYWCGCVYGCVYHRWTCRGNDIKRAWFAWCVPKMLIPCFESFGVRLALRNGMNDTRKLDLQDLGLAVFVGLFGSLLVILIVMLAIGR